MSVRTKIVLSAIMAAAGAALFAGATPAATGRSWSAGIGTIIVGLALMAAGFLLSKQRLCRTFAVHREVRRGLRQIEMVLELEAGLWVRQLTVAGANGGCPNCGAPAGPHCICRKG